jgi:hypothetical protein
MKEEEEKNKAKETGSRGSGKTKKNVKQKSHIIIFP